MVLLLHIALMTLHLVAMLVAGGAGAVYLRTSRKLKTSAASALRLAVVLLCLLALAACGQTGALYFDEDPPADQLPPSKKSGAKDEQPKDL